jgi:hypothetical protein
MDKWHFGFRAMILWFFLSVISSTWAADCSPGNIILSSQSDVDNFQSEHGPCDRVVSDLKVVGKDISNLGGLSSLSTVNGSLIIEGNETLTSLHGLSALTVVGIDPGYNLEITGNPVLTDLDGLTVLAHVGGGLIIHINDSLKDISGLSSLSSAFLVHIAANPSLVNIKGLSSLSSVVNLGVVNNASLMDLGDFSALNKIDGWLEIYANPKLSNVDGLSMLRSIGGTADVFGFLRIEANTALKNLNGLSALISVGSGLYVGSNSSLADCSGVAKLVDPIDDGEAGPGEEGFPDVGGKIELENNLPGCNSALEILAGFPLTTMNAGLNDVWYNPDTNGQGFFIIVLPEIEQIFMAWFTYDTERPPANVSAVLGEPGHRWLTAQGIYAGNVADLDVSVTAGGVFDSPYPRPLAEPDGEILLEFSTCNAGVVTYDIPSIDRQSVVPIERIVLDNVTQCYLLDSRFHSGSGQQ